MKLSRKDWPHIRMGGSAFLLSLGLGGAFILLSENYLTDAHITQRSSQQQLNEARKQLTGAREDRDNMDAYTTEYSVLLNHNILSTNQRLDWLEGLDKLKQQNHVLDFKYTISPQQNFAPNPPWDNGNFDLKQSAMTLQFELLHEGQLIHFFDALHTQVKGRYILERCVLERKGTVADNFPIGVSNTTAQIHATCHGGWLALQNRSTS